MIQQKPIANGFVKVIAKDETTGMWHEVGLPEPVGELTDESWVSGNLRGYRLLMDGVVVSQYTELIR